MEVSLIDQIQDKNIPVSTLLIKAKITANKLGDAKFLKWLNLEMNGYKLGDTYPKYRILIGQVKFWNPFYGWCPIVFTNPDAETYRSSRGANQSISEIEELLSKEPGQYEMPFSDSDAAEIMKDSGIPPKVTLMVSSTSLVGILNKVRNLLLDWVLELQNDDLKDEKPVVLDEKRNVQKLKFDLSFSPKNGSMLLVDQDGKKYEIKIQGQVQKEVLRVIFQNPRDVYTNWSLYEISEILGKSDVNEKAVHNAIYQFNKKVQLAIPEVQHLFELTKHSTKLDPKYINKT